MFNFAPEQWYDKYIMAIFAIGGIIALAVITAIPIFIFIYGVYVLFNQIIR
jgi:hypothetical protein